MHGRTLQPSAGASRQQVRRRETAPSSYGQRTKVILAAHDPAWQAGPSTSAARLQPVSSIAPRRTPASWASEPGPHPIRPAGAASGGMTALMGPDGKASSLRKLVVDGVDDSASVQVKFCLKYRTSYGQSVKIIGSHPKLGLWDINKALVLAWTEGDRWVATLELPAGSVYEYKYVLVDHDGRSALAWQGGGNSVLALGDQDEQGVEVQDNWHNNPAQAAVLAGGQSTTRENKLAAWADEMRQYRALARSAQYELTRKSEELQAGKAQVARLKMELSMSVKAREDIESRLAAVENENLSLRAQVAQSQIAMKSTLEEAIKLLQQEIEEGEEDVYSVGVGEEDEDLDSSNSNSNGSSSSSNGGWGGWGRSGKEAETAYAGSNSSSNSSSSTPLERFGFRLGGSNSH
ncbi:Phosphoglucan, water dikinase, chloroplastic [Tetrabaena socialis]|uniref:Phosphoglucan, water dikinase, chloroplastic n=1 Tax=Tetrabaena socialis TaxID=47790 RepID=A0A2J7ZNQ6_9CHLO|nr:Phosphoglucan, water dikinase, chloroplastic [Tetrabaena socialis]|eukprot:PNH01901.1 Phosphoglucan, water dikinase, chloroplastic [Tetrabaena socialis]